MFYDPPGEREPQLPGLTKSGDVEESPKVSVLATQPLNNRVFPGQKEASPQCHCPVSAVPL